MSLDVHLQRKTTQTCISVLAFQSFHSTWSRGNLKTTISPIGALVFTEKHPVSIAIETNQRAIATDEDGKPVLVVDYDVDDAALRLSDLSLRALHVLRPPTGA